MNQFRPRPIRDLSSLEGLSKLANQAADLSFRNDLQEHKTMQEANRRANVSRYMSMLDNVQQEPDLDKRNLIRSKIGLGLRGLGENIDPRFLNFEDKEKVTQPDYTNIDREVIEGNRLKGFRDIYKKQDMGNPEAKPIRSILTKDVPYTDPSTKEQKEIDKIRGNQEAKDLEDYRSKYNKANAFTKQLEDSYGKENLMNWQKDIAVGDAVRILDTDPISFESLLNEGKIDKTVAQRAKYVSDYRKSVSAKKEQDANLSGKGYYVDDNGKLIKGKKNPEQEPPKPYKAVTKTLTDAQGNKIEITIE